MNKYEYLTDTVHVPTGWHEVTVALYDRIWPMKPKTARERSEVVAIACGTSLELFLGWPAEVIEMILIDVRFLFTDNPVPPSPAVVVAGIQYNVAIEEKLSFGEYIDVDDVQKNSDAILSNVLAIVCRPAGEKYNPDNNNERAALFGALPVSEVQGVLAFFLHYYQISTRRTRLCANLREMAGLLPPSIVPLIKLGDFTKLSLIWRVIKYGFLMKLLRARLRKFSPSYYTNGIKGLRRSRKTN